MNARSILGWDKQWKSILTGGRNYFGLYDIKPTFSKAPL